jgi:hypothetical protein
VGDARMETPSLVILVAGKHMEYMSSHAHDHAESTLSTVNTGFQAQLQQLLAKGR